MLPALTPAPHSPRGFALLGALLGLGGPMIGVAQAAPAPAQPSSAMTRPADASPEPSESMAEPSPAATAESEPEPVCPAGSLCHDGHCFVACDPTQGECDAVPESEPEPEPEPEPDSMASGQPTSVVDPTETEPEPEPEPTSPLNPELEPELTGFGLRIAPSLGMCVGAGCQQIRVGTAAGGMGLGGGLDLRMTYRATPHVSLEVGGLSTVHGNDIDADPLVMWIATLVGPRLHLSGGRWRAEPVVGLGVGYVRSLVRWTDAGAAADGLALSADVGLQMRLVRRVSLAMLGGGVLPYWTRVCDADLGVKSCHSRSTLDSSDLGRALWTASVAVIIHFS